MVTVIHSSSPIGADGIVRCFCDVPAASLTSQTPANPNRKFFRCGVKGGDECKFFSWADAVMTPRTPDKPSPSKRSRYSPEPTTPPRDGPSSSPPLSQGASEGRSLYDPNNTRRSLTQDPDEDAGNDSDSTTLSTYSFWGRSSRHEAKKGKVKERAPPASNSAQPLDTTQPPYMQPKTAPNPQFKVPLPPPSHQNGSPIQMQSNNLTKALDNPFVATSSNTPTNSKSNLFAVAGNTPMNTPLSQASTPTLLNLSPSPTKASFPADMSSTKIKDWSDQSAAYVGRLERKFRNVEQQSERRKLLLDKQSARLKELEQQIESKEIALEMLREENRKLKEEIDRS